MKLKKTGIENSRVAAAVLSPQKGCILVAFLYLNRFHLIDRTKSGTFWPWPEKKNDVTHSE